MPGHSLSRCCHPLPPSPFPALAHATGAPTLFAATDPTTTTIRVEAAGETRTATWKGLRGDAKRFPHVVPLQGQLQDYFRLRVLP